MEDDSIDDGFCEFCRPLLEIAQRPRDASFADPMLDQPFSVELTKDDVMEVVLFFKSDQRMCRCLFQESSVYWLLFPMLSEVSLWIISGPITCLEWPEDSDVMDVSTESSLYSLDERRACLCFVQNLFNDQFPLYQHYKPDRLDEPKEGDRKNLRSIFAGYHQLPYPQQHLMLNLLQHDIFGTIAAILDQCDTDTVPFSIASAIINVIFQARCVLPPDMRQMYIYQCILAATHYLVNLVRENAEFVRDGQFRAVCESLCKAAGEDIEFGVNQQLISLAVQHLESPYLAPRICGLHLICEYIHASSDPAPAMAEQGECDYEKIQSELAIELQNQDIVAKVFGLNAHQELIKQAVSPVEFLAKQEKLVKEDLDCIWGVAQKKDCSRSVFDLLVIVVKYMEPNLVLHLYNLLKLMKTSDHTETSLHLVYTVTETVWQLSLIRTQFLQNRAKRRSAESISIDSSAKAHDTSLESVESETTDGGSTSSSGGGSSEVAAVMSNRGVGDAVNLEQRPSCGSHTGQKKVIIENEGDSSNGEDSDDSEEIIQESMYYNPSTGLTQRPAEPPSKRPSSDSHSDSQQTTPKKRRLVGDSGPTAQSTPRNPVISVVVEGKVEPQAQTHTYDHNRQLLDQLRQPRRHDFQGLELESESDVSSDRMTSASDQVLDDDDDFGLGLESGSFVEDEDSDLGMMRQGLGGISRNIPDEIVLSAFMRPRVEIVHQHQQQMLLKQQCRVARGEVVFPVFRLEDLTKPGHTLLWDLVMKEGQDALGADEMKHAVSWLTELNKIFVHVNNVFLLAVLDNLKRHRCSYISLLLFPRLLRAILWTYNRDANKQQMIIPELDNRHQMMELFFKDLKHYCEVERKMPNQKYSWEKQLQIRFEVLDIIFDGNFSCMQFGMTMAHFRCLCSCLFPDPHGRMRLCTWLLQQITSATGHALTEDLVEDLVDDKLNQFLPELMSSTELLLLKALLNRTSSREALDLCLGLLWRVALKNINTDVSRSAMSILSSHYVSMADPTEAAMREEDFVRLCTTNLRNAVQSLDEGVDEKHLTEIHRALMILKTHLEDFRRRHSFIIRIWELDNRLMRAHLHRLQVLEMGPTTITVNFQISGSPEKPRLMLNPLDTVGELRADVAAWICGHLRQTQDQSTDMDLDQTPPNVTVQRDGSFEQSSSPSKPSPIRTQPSIYLSPHTLNLRLLFSGHELTQGQNDSKRLIEVGIHENCTISVSFSAQNSPIPVCIFPGPEATPMYKLLQEDNWNLLMTVIDKLLFCAAKVEPADRVRCVEFASRAWELIMSLPTNVKYEQQLTQILEHERDVDCTEIWNRVLDSSRKHNLLYALQILSGGGFMSEKYKNKFTELGGVRHLLSILHSKSLFPDDKEEWTQWDLDSLTSLIRVVNHCVFIREGLETRWFTNLMADRRLDPNRANTPPIVPLCDLTLFENRADKLIVILMDLIRELCLERPMALVCSLSRVPTAYTAFHLLTTVMFSDPQLLGVFLQYDKLVDWLKSLILECSDYSLRNQVVIGLHRLWISKTPAGASPGRELVIPILKSLLSALKDAHALEPSPYEEFYCRKKHIADLSLKEPRGPSSMHYFLLLHTLIETIKPTETALLESLQLTQVADQVYNYLLERPIYEKRDSFLVDHGLKGLLQLITDIVKLVPDWKTTDKCRKLVCEVWDFVFKLPSTTNKNIPKCKSDDTKMAAFDLLVELCRGCDHNFSRIYLWLMQQHNRSLQDTFPWEYWPQDEQRSPCGLVGLINLGATCYMATALQHVFMLPRVRAAVLEMESGQILQHQEAMHELQKLFAFLHESERKAYDPRPFCHAYQMDGQRMNTAEQKDMTEFFTDFITKLEETNLDLKRQLKSLFCGVMSNNVVSEDCKHVSKVTEEFYTVRCQVADMKDLQASLDELTIADILEGENMYTCSQCNKKVRAKKRACFKQLPEIMSFNTMRYSFNMLTMMKEKVNTHFSFPRELDMRPYMEETLLPDHASVSEESNYLYQLIGVTVHTGTAEGGHYYSFVKDPFDTEKWYCCNDADVKSWDPAQLASDCFGGELTRQQYDTSSDRFLDLSFEKANSAYMVFYQRMEAERQETEVKQREINLPKDIEEWIWKDNNKFRHDLLLFSHNYNNFVLQMCATVPHSLLKTDVQLVTLQSTQLCFRYVLDTLIHAKEKPNIQNFSEQMLKQLESCPEAANWFLNTMVEDPKWPLEILIKSPVSQCRQLFERLIVQVFGALRDKHKDEQLLEPWKEGDSIEKYSPREIGPQSPLSRFIQTLLGLLHNQDLGVEMRQLCEYFSLLLNFAKDSVVAQRYLLLASTIRVLVHYYMMRTQQEMSEPSYEDCTEEDLHMLGLLRHQVCVHRSTWVGPSLERMIHLIIVLLRAAKANDSFIRNDCWHILVGGGKGFAFLTQQIRDASNTKLAAELIVAVCDFRAGLKKAMVQELLNCISHAQKDNQAQPFLAVLSHLCLSEQGFTKLVTERIWGAAEHRAIYCLSWLQKIVPDCQEIQEWLFETRDEWAEKFLFIHPSCNTRQAAGDLLLSLIPSSCVRQSYQQFLSPHRPERSLLTSPKPQSLPESSLSVLHKVLDFMLHLLPSVCSNTFSTKHPYNRLVHYLTALRACLISCDEKRMVVPFVPHLWHLFEQCPRQEKIVPNKQSLLLFWWTACQDCTPMVDASLKVESGFYQSFMHNCVHIDERDRDLNMYNRSCLAAYYGLMALLAQRSLNFRFAVMQHENIIFAIKSVWPMHEYKQAFEAISQLLQICCRDSTVSDKTKLFKHKVWKAVRDTQCSSRSNFPLLLQALRFLTESPDDKLHLLENDVLNVLSKAFNTVHHMYHNATAVQSSVGDLSEVLKRLYDFLQRTNQCKETGKMDKTVSSILGKWTTVGDVAKQLLQLLNSYVPHDVRQESLKGLRLLAMLYDNNLPVINNMLTYIGQTHQSKHSSGNLISNQGPYFPKRGVDRQEMAQKTVHPPQPMLDMALNSMQLETAKGVDPSYDQQLNDYFSSYHGLVDLLIRCCVNLFGEHGYDGAGHVAELSALIGWEAVPLQNELFPKLWLDVCDKAESNKPEVNSLIAKLEQNSFFADYLCSVLTGEQTNLSLPFTFKFFEKFLPKMVSSKDLLNDDHHQGALENASNAIEALCLSLESGENEKIVKQCPRAIGASRAVLLLVSVLPEIGHQFLLDILKPLFEKALKLFSQLENSDANKDMGQAEQVVRQVLTKIDEITRCNEEKTSE